MFVGIKREAAVSRLLADWVHAKANDPRMVFLSGPMGWGKTRIVQEFYARLVAAEGNGYWPETIVAGPPAEDVSLLTKERKRLRPESFVAVGAAPFIWLSVHSDASEMARPEEAYRSLAEQLEPHLQPILRQKRLTRAAATTLWKALTSFIPIPADVGTYLDVSGAVKDFLDEWRTGRSPHRVTDPDPTQEQAANFWRLLTAVWGPDGRDGPPIVLTIEDAQFISDVSAELIRTLLTSKLPVLVIAAGWPSTDRDDTRTEPFFNLIDANLTSVRVDELDQLGQVEMEALIRAWHPGTAESVTRLLAERTRGNPYALRLALIRLHARRGASVVASDERVSRMPFDIHAQFESLLWAMSDAARLGLAATAILGYRLPLAMAEGGVASIPEASLAGALKTDWLRSDVDSKALLTFLEPLRHEVAQHHAQQSFSVTERGQVLQSGLEVVRRLLSDDIADPHRALLHDLHLRLAEEDVELDVGAALHSASQLLVELRARSAKASVRGVLNRADKLLTSSAPAEAVAEYAVERAHALRFAMTRADLATVEAVDSAAEAVDALQGKRPDLGVRVLLERARLHRVVDIPEQYNLASARRALDAAIALTDAAGLHNHEVEHDLRLCEYGVVSAEQNRTLATKLALHEARRCQLPDGSQTVDSLGALSDAGWYAARAGNENLSVALSRELVQLRIDYWGADTHPRVALTQKDLAVRLVRLGRDELMQEAYEICVTAYRTIEAAFGPEDTGSLNALSARGYSAIRWGLTLHGQGHIGQAQDLFRLGLADAQTVQRARRRIWPRSEYLLGQEREALARAINGDATGIEDAIGHLARRTGPRNQKRSQAEVQWLVADIRRAMIHLGQDARAADLAEQYPEVRPE